MLRAIRIAAELDFAIDGATMAGIADNATQLAKISKERIRAVTDVLKEGDQVRVKVLEVDRSGKIRLSRREAMADDGVEE